MLLRKTPIRLNIILNQVSYLYEMAYLLDRVDWYAQIANEEARTVHTVPARANQKASPSLQESPRTKG